MQPALIFLIAILSASTLRAQLCDGELRVVLLAAGDTVRFSVDSSSYEPSQFAARRLVSRDGTFGVRAMPRGRGYHFPDAILRMPYRHSGFDVRTGCGGDIELTIARSSGGAVDSMRITAVNSCDLHAELTLDYEPGRFDVLVCDTTRYPAATIEGWRYHPTPYVSSHWGGALVASVSLTRDDAPAIDSTTVVHTLRLVDRRGDPVEHPLADVRVRLLPAVSANPRFPGARVRDLSVDGLPDRIVWQRLHRLDEPGTYALHLPPGVRFDSVAIELWVKVPGYLWWGPMLAGGSGRPVTLGRPKTEITVTLDHGSSAELAPFNRMEIRYDYFSRLVVVPVDESESSLDASALKGLPGVASAYDDVSRRAGGDVRRRSILLVLDRDLLAAGDPLLERLRSDPRTAEAGPAVRADIGGYGISSPHDRLGALPRRFVVYSDDREGVRALAVRLGVEAISVDPREMRWEIIAPIGTGNAVAAYARDFAAARGIRSVELYVGPVDATPEPD